MLFLRVDIGCAPLEFHETRDYKSFPARGNSYNYVFLCLAPVTSFPALSTGGYKNTSFPAIGASCSFFRARQRLQVLLRLAQVRLLGYSVTRFPTFGITCVFPH